MKRDYEVMPRNNFSRVAKDMQCQLWFPLPSENVVLLRSGLLKHLDQHAAVLFPDPTAPTAPSAPTPTAAPAAAPTPAAMPQSGLQQGPAALESVPTDLTAAPEPTAVPLEAPTQHAAAGPSPTAVPSDAPTQPSPAVSNCPASKRATVQLDEPMASEPGSGPPAETLPVQPSRAGLDGLQNAPLGPAHSHGGALFEDTTSQLLATSAPASPAALNMDQGLGGSPPVMSGQYHEAAPGAGTSSPPQDGEPAGSAVGNQPPLALEVSSAADGTTDAHTALEGRHVDDAQALGADLIKPPHRLAPASTDGVPAALPSPDATAAAPPAAAAIDTDTLKPPEALALSEGDQTEQLAPGSPMAEDGPSVGSPSAKRSTASPPPAIPVDVEMAEAAALPAADEGLEPRPAVASDHSAATTDVVMPEPSGSPAAKEGLDPQAAPGAIDSSGATDLVMSEAGAELLAGGLSPQGTLQGPSPELVGGAARLGKGAQQAPQAAQSSLAEPIPLSADAAALKAHWAQLRAQVNTLRPVERFAVVSIAYRR